MTQPTEISIKLHAFTASHFRRALVAAKKYVSNSRLQLDTYRRNRVFINENSGTEFEARQQSAEFERINLPSILSKDYQMKASNLRSVMLLLLLLLLVGCSSNTKTSEKTSRKSAAHYFVIGSERAVVTPKEDGACRESHCEVLYFTMLHDGVKIRTKCQTFDSQNQCSSLEVGKSYEFRRVEELRYLTLDDNKIVLSIERETLGASD